ncbi:Uncharacterised protein [Streptococcus pneumoniae]|nr:Uncharacterised protein [Streptococcus pneumoniae]
MLKYNNLVSVKIDKLTNELTGFIKLTDDKEVKQILSREECLQKALQFLERVIPDITQYLRLGRNVKKQKMGLKDLSFLYI